MQNLEDVEFQNQQVEACNKLSKSDLTKVRFDIKIADLGYAKTLEPGTLSKSKVGTDMLYAPELLKGSYDHKIDVWGIAHIFYILIAR